MSDWQTEATLLQAVLNETRQQLAALRAEVARLEKIRTGMAETWERHLAEFAATEDDLASLREQLEELLKAAGKQVEAVVVALNTRGRLTRGQIEGISATTLALKQALAATRPSPQQDREEK